MSVDGEIDAIEVRLFLEAIFARYGYDLRDYSQPTLGRRVHTALANSGCKHLGELQHAVLNDPQVFAHVLDALTIRVSEMFRDPSFYRALRAQVLPILRTYPLLKIWHCGCAAGEEVYASAILLSEEGLYERCQIYATDLSPQALEQAKLGAYPASELAKFTDNYEKSGGRGGFSSYYTQAYGGIAMNESLKRNVVFFQHNLVSDYVFGEMNVVFCRNVMIYFGSELRQQVLDKLTRSVCPGGFLALGSAERLGKVAGFADFVADERIYRNEQPT